MVSNICTRLLRKNWRKYDVDEIPHIEGIYVIGVVHHSADTEVVYVGRSNDVHRRMVEHKRQDLAVDHFVQEKFEENGGEDLRVKWIEEDDQETTEHEYIECIAQKEGRWPRFNIRG